MFFPSDQLCGNFANEFYEISRVRHMFAVARNIVVGGERKRVVKIMTFKQSWIYTNFINPLKEIQESRRKREAAKRKSSSCVIS